MLLLEAISICFGSISMSIESARVEFAWRLLDQSYLMSKSAKST